MADSTLVLSRQYTGSGTYIIDNVIRPNAQVYSELLATGFLYSGNLFYPEADEGFAVYRPGFVRAEIGAYDNSQTAGTTGRSIETFTKVTTLLQKIRSLSNKDTTNATMSTISELYARDLVGDLTVPNAMSGRNAAVKDLMLAAIQEVDFKTEEQIYKKILNDDHWVKTDGDGVSGIEGAIKTFAQDVTAVRPAVTQVVNLADGITEADGRTLMAEIRKAAVGTSVRQNMFYSRDLITMLLPQSVGNAYYAAFEYVKDYKTFRGDVEKTDGTFTPLNSFTANGILFVCLPDEWFLKSADAGTPYRCLILPRNSISVCIPYPKKEPTGFIRASGTAMDEMIFRMEAAAGNLMEVVPDVRGVTMWKQMGERGMDPMIRNMGTGGMPIYDRGTMTAHFEVNPTSTGTHSRSYSFEYNRYLGVIRRFPQYIQEFKVPLTLLPAVASGFSETPQAQPVETEGRRRGM